MTNTSRHDMEMSLTQSLTEGVLPISLPHLSRKYRASDAASSMACSVNGTALQKLNTASLLDTARFYVLGELGKSKPSARWG